MQDEILSVIRSIRVRSAFCNKICQLRTHAPQQTALLFEADAAAGDARSRRLELREEPGNLGVVATDTANKGVSSQ